MKQQLEQSQDGTLSFRPTVDGKNVRPSSATVSMYRQDGQTDMPDSPVSGAGADVAADGLLSFSVSAARLALLGENYVADWVFVWNGNTYRRRDLFDVVRHALYPVATDEDLRTRMSSLSAVLFKNPTRTFAGELDAAWRQLYSDIESRGRRPWLILEASQLRDVHCALALSMIYDGQSQEADDVWWKRKKEQLDLYKQLLDRLPFRYDQSNDGVIQPTEDRNPWSSADVVRY